MMMEKDDDLRTIACLRGRLIAERASSRLAKENAELMENKLIELEKRMKEEIKFKKKAEKKLNLLKKKLESLNINHVSGNSEASSCSSFIESSCSSPSISSLTKPQEEEHNDNPKFTVYDKCGVKEIDQNLAEIISSQDNYNPQNHSNVTQKVDSLQNSSESSLIQSFEDPNNDDHSLKSTMQEKAINEGNESANDDDDGSVDNSLAMVLVPSNLQVRQQSHNTEMKMVNKSVGEVLDALRQAKEKLQSSIERQNVIRFGSVGTQMCS